jgi:6,7-dimethyl-8-ribityllumazine synthase
MIHIEGTTDARGLRFAIVVARFNDFVTNRLRDGAVEALQHAGASLTDIAVVPVPGSFEIPMVAQKLAETGNVDAVICLGCLIRGATAHFEYIASAVAHGITAAAAATGVPMTFGVLTTNSAEEALERAGARSANKGWEAAIAAVEIATLFKRLNRPATGAVRG